MMATWWFVRHAESTANAHKWIAGHHDAPLTELGRVQARDLATRLEAIRPTRVVSSDLQRARHTAELAWHGREPSIEVHAALRERHMGSWEGKARASLRSDGAMDTLTSWSHGPPQGESQRALSRRVLTWLASQPEGVDTLVFAHGGVIRCVIGLLDGVDRRAIGRTKVGNVQCIERQVRAATWESLLTRL